MTQSKEYTMYNEAIITRKVRLPYTAVGANLEENLYTMISHLMQGKCSQEGYIQVGTMKILTYSVGLQIANDIEFDVVIKCYVCCPVNGMILSCEVKNKTLAGIRAEYTFDQELKQQVSIIKKSIENTNTEKQIDKIEKNIIEKMGRKENYNSPIVVYLASDQHNQGTVGNKLEKIKVGESITVEVIGQRFELNDDHVNIIGKLIN